MAWIVGGLASPLHIAARGGASRVPRVCDWGGDDDRRPRQTTTGGTVAVVPPYWPRFQMTVSLARAGVWMLEQTVHTDTVLMRQVGQERGWFATASLILNGLMSLAILVITVAIVPMARNLRKSYGRLNEMLDKIYVDVNPLVKNASGIAENVNAIAKSIRGDLQVVSGTVAMATERLHEAVAITEQRLNEFNALLEVVQQEAESVFVATASVVRGVRTGTASLHHEDDEEYAHDAVLPTSEELDDGNDDSDHSETGATRPRIRPRARGWGGT